MKVQAKQLTFEDLGARVVRTDKHGTTKSQIISGVSHSLTSPRFREGGGGGELVGPYQVTVITFSDGTKIPVSGLERIELDEDITPLKVVVENPGLTGLR